MSEEAVQAVLIIPLRRRRRLARGHRHVLCRPNDLAQVGAFFRRDGRDGSVDAGYCVAGVDAPRQISALRRNLGTACEMR